MARQRGGLVGRRVELDALVEGGVSGPVLVHGLPGSGKTALLQEACRVFTGRAQPVLSVHSLTDGPAWDRFGFRAVLDAVRGQYELFDAHPRLPDSLDEVSKLCTEDGYADPWTRFGLLHAMSTLYTRLNTSAAVTVVLDDVDHLPDPMPAVAPVHRAGHLVIASCTVAPERVPTPLGETFSRMIELGPLSPDRTSDLLRRLAGPVSPTVERSVREALGPLWGNPGAVVSTMNDLRDRGRLDAVGGRTRLRDPATPVALPAGHPCFELLAPLGEVGRQVVLLASSPEGLLVDDLRFLEGNAGRAVDTLLRDGLLDWEPSGLIRCRIPGIGTAVEATAVEGARERLHGAIAERMLEPGDGPGARPGAAARHIASAGQALPSREEFGAVLRSAEVTLAADAATSTRHLLAAWWHTGPGAGRVAFQRRVIRHLVRVADYSAMAGFAADASKDELRAGERAELAVAATLAALHLGQPVPREVREELGRDEESGSVVRLADSWFSGDRVEPDGIAACLLPVWQRIGCAPAESNPLGRERLYRDSLIADACAVRDLAPAFEAVLGQDYQVPARGPLSAYHRIRSGYAEGRWNDALAALEELELQDTVSELVLEHARLLAAEMRGWNDDGHQAVALLDIVPQPGYFPHHRAWVEAGLRHRAGETEKAFEAGQRALRAHPFARDEVGVARLLVRLAWLAGRVENKGQRRVVVELAETYHERRKSSRSSGVLGLVRGLSGDGAEIETAERLVRWLGDRELVLLGTSAAQLSGSPEGRLREAYENTRPGGVPQSAGAVEQPAAEVLSGTELEILELIRSGQTNRQIARRVRMSEKTVEKYLSRLFTKAGCRTRYGLATSKLGRHQDAIGA
ncbi:helix-turn-helix transcriptional regulator [Amycolatopsis sp. lyj-90]|uniref:helix-turn-helix transcriptional regulator n=1 Tax=Amycolatopsis sp. lyj-90 TaxID=2789285 RepID=UPI00397A8EA5